MPCTLGSAEDTKLHVEHACLILTQIWANFTMQHENDIVLRQVSSKGSLFSCWFNYINVESFYNDKIPSVISEFEKAGLGFKIDVGRIMEDFDIKDNTFYFIKLEDWLQKHSDFDLKLPVNINGVIKKYWPYISGSYITNKYTTQQQSDIKQISDRYKEIFFAPHQT